MCPVRMLSLPALMIRAPTGAPQRVTMVVANPFVHDSRVLKQAGMLVSRGWMATVIAAAGAGLPAQELREGIQVVRVPREPRTSKLAKAVLAHRRSVGSDAVSYAPRGDVTGVELHARRALEALTHGRFWRHATIAAGRIPADIVVAHDLDALPAGRLIAWWHRVPLVYDSHELWLEVPPLLARSGRSTRRW